MPCAQKLMRGVFGVLAAAAAMAPATGAHAHPHTWIDLVSTIVLTGDGKIDAVRAHWTFDEAYTTDLMRQAGGVQAFADTALTNLAPYGYFTHLRDATGPLAFRKPQDIGARLDRKRLVLEFTLPLARPAGPDAEISVFDPTYYIEMLHGRDDAIRFEGAAAARCRARITAAQPSAETRRRAMDMDRQATADHSLGEQFAERIDITCS